jgi:hypothetical protein
MRCKFGTMNHYENNTPQTFLFSKTNERSLTIVSLSVFRHRFVKNGAKMSKI